jgi:hypothetical protein
MKEILRLILGAGFAMLSVTTISKAAELQPGTKKAWNDYLRVAALRADDRLQGRRTFLWTDESPDRALRVRRGEVLVAPIVEHGTKGIENGLIHDWIGAAFIPSTTAHHLRAVLGDYDQYKQIYRPVVADSKLLACTSTDQELSMIWQRKVLFVNAALAVQFQVHDIALDEHRGYIAADSVQVQEIENYGRRGEHLLPVGTGSGFIWRLRSIARYQERDGGVYLELEVIALTRDIPSSLRWLVNPVLNHLSTNSVTTTLRQTREAVRALPDRADQVARRRVTHANSQAVLYGAE